MLLLISLISTLRLKTEFKKTCPTNSNRSSAHDLSVQVKQMDAVFNSSFHNPSPVLEDAEQKYFWMTRSFFLVNKCKLFGEIHEKKSESHHLQNSAVCLPNTHSHKETLTLYNDLSGLKKQHTENCLYKSSWRDQNIFRVTYTYRCKMHSDNITMSWQ